jgi:hypothetical protein
MDNIQMVKFLKCYKKPGIIKKSKMYKSVLLAIFAIITTGTFPQEFQIGLGTGIGTFNMSDLKGLNTKINKVLPFENRIVSSFPANQFYQLSAIFKDKNFGFGLCYNFESTGSRISSQDYSGQYKLDMTIYSHVPGFYGEYDIPIFNNIYLGLYSMAGIELTNLNIKEYLNVLNTSMINKSYQFTAQNAMIMPGIEINYVMKYFGVKLNTGYLLQTKTDLFSKNSDPEVSPYINLYPLKPDWSGFRIGLSVFYRIVYSKSDEGDSQIKTKDFQWIHKK